MRAHAQSGFTLLETLVALVVLGMLIGGLTQGIRFGIEAWQAQKRGLAARGDLHGTDTLLRHLVARMNPGGVSGQAPTIVGTARRLTFTTILPQPADVVTTHEADVTLMVDDAHRLQLLWLTHDRHRAGPPPPPARATLLDEVDHLEIAYWKDARSGWSSTWTGPARPRLVRIGIAFTGASGRRAPAIVVAPMRDRWQL